MIVWWVLGLWALGAEPVDDKEIKQGLQQVLHSPEVEDAGPRPGAVAALLANPVGMASVDLPEPSRKVRDGPAVHALLQDRVLVVGVRFQCGKCDRDHMRSATAFLIAPGLAVTNHHVLAKEDGEAAAVMSWDRRFFPIKEVVLADEATDLAVVRVGLDRPGLPLARTLPENGEPVYILSHPGNHHFSFTDGVVSRLEKTPDGVYLNVTAPFARGSSGAPVVDQRGNVVGIVRATEALYGDEDQEHQQMVIRQVIPVTTLRVLLQAPSEPTP